MAVEIAPLRRTASRASRIPFNNTSSAAISGAFDPGTGLGQLGQGLGEAGDRLSALALQMAEEDNETKAKEADVRIAERIRRITMGDPSDPQAAPGFLATQGKTTIGSFSAAEEAVRAAVREEVEKAGNPSLSRMIVDKANRRLDTALNRMVGHASEQRLVVQQRVSEAREAQALADVSADWQSDSALSDGLGIVAAEVFDRAEAQGMEAESRDALLAERQSVIIKGAFDAALASSDVRRAQAIFSQHADKLTGAVRTTMAQALAADQQASIAQELAGEALAKFPNNPAAMRSYIREATEGKQESLAIAQLNSMLQETRNDTRFAISMRTAIFEQESRNLPLDTQNALERMDASLSPGATEAEQREWIQANLSGRLEESTLTALDRRFSRERGDISNRRTEEEFRRSTERFAVSEATAAHTQKQRERAEELRKARSSAYDFLYQDRPDGTTPTLREWRQRNPELFEILSREGGAEELVNVERKIKEGNTFAIAPDGETAEEILTMPYEELAKVNPLSQRHKLTEGEYSKVITAVASARRRVESDARSAPLYNQADAALQNFKPVNFKEKGSVKNDKIWQLARTSIRNWISDRLEAGNFPTPPEIDREAARLMMQVDASTSLFTNDFEGLAAQAVEMTPEQRAVATVDFKDIPPLILQQIDALIGAGYSRIQDEITNEDREELAGAIAMGDRERFFRILESKLER